MERINIQFYKTKYAEFIIGSYGQKLCLLGYRYRKMRSAVDKIIQQGLGAEYIERCDETIEIAKSRLDEYFQGQSSLFDIPLLIVGSNSQKKVWNGLGDSLK